MKRFHISALLLLGLAVASPTVGDDAFPPNWLPVEHLDREAKWDDDEPPFTDGVRIYLPTDKPVRGVFVCFVFHSAGLHAIYAVGVNKDGQRTASQPAIAVAK